MKRSEYQSYRNQHMTMADYILYGAKATALRGEQLPHSKLDAEKVRYVRKNPKGMTAKQLAALFGVHQRTIDKVRDGRSWQNVLVSMSSS